MQPNQKGLNLSSAIGGTISILLVPLFFFWLKYCLDISDLGLENLAIIILLPISLVLLGVFLVIEIILVIQYYKRAFSKKTNSRKVTKFKTNMIISVIALFILILLSMMMFDFLPLTALPCLVIIIFVIVFNILLPSIANKRENSVKTLVEE